MDAATNFEQCCYQASSRVRGADKVAAKTSPLSIGGHLLAVSRLCFFAFIRVFVFVVSPFGNIRYWATNRGRREAYVYRIARYSNQDRNQVPAGRNSHEHSDTLIRYRSAPSNLRFVYPSPAPIVAASRYGHRNTVLTAQRDPQTVATRHRSPCRGERIPISGPSVSRAVVVSKL